MTNDKTLLLIEAWLDGAIDDVGLAQLEVALLESEEVRREFWRRASLHGAVREAAKIRFAGLDGESRHAAESRPAPALSVRRSLLQSGIALGTALLLVSGCGLGSVVTSLAFAYSGLLTRGPNAVVIHEEGFEHPPAPESQHVPQRLDVWSGDETTAVGAEYGIVPQSGSKMLKFLSSGPRGATYRGAASEIWRVIDLESLRAAAGTHDVRIDFSASFNGCAGSGEPRRCWISAIATDADPHDLGDDWGEQFEAAHENPIAVATAQVRERIDADPATWQRFTVTVTTPPKARYLLLHCLTEYRPDEDHDVATRCGQYVDDIDVTVSPAEPPVAILTAHRKEVRR